MTEPDDLLTRLRKAAAAFLALRQGVLAGEPWPLAAAFDSSPEAQWGPPEVLAHVAEMLPYWLGEVERIVAAAPVPAPFGRSANDGVRLAIIGRDRTVPLRELFDRVASDSARFERRLAALGATDLDKVGLHPVGGLVVAGDVVEGFVVAHLADHAAQLRELLSMPPSAAGG
jgi:DinB superfamily